MKLKNNPFLATMATAIVLGIIAGFIPTPDKARAEGNIYEACIPAPEGAQICAIKIPPTELPCPEKTGLFEITIDFNRTIFARDFFTHRYRFLTGYRFHDCSTFATIETSMNRLSKAYEVQVAELGPLNWVVVDDIDKRYETRIQEILFGLKNSEDQTPMRLMSSFQSSPKYKLFTAGVAAGQ